MIAQLQSSFCFKTASAYVNFSHHVCRYYFILQLHSDIGLEKQCCQAILPFHLKVDFKKAMLKKQKWFYFFNVAFFYFWSVVWIMLQTINLNFFMLTHQTAKPPSAPFYIAITLKFFVSNIVTFIVTNPYLDICICDGKCQSRSSLVKNLFIYLMCKHSFKQQCFFTPTLLSSIACLNPCQNEA